MNLGKTLFILSLLTLASSCMKVDNTVGEDFIPEKDKLSMTIDKFGDFEIATLSVDSVRIDNYPYSYIGSLISNRYGRTTVAYTTELLHTLVDADTIFTETAVIDSVRLRLYAQSYLGDINAPITISMYELDSLFRAPTNIEGYENLDENDEYNKRYYSNFKYWNYIKDTPVITYTAFIHDAIADGNYITTHLPKSFGQQYFDAPKEIYKEDSLFRKKFKGYCFVTPKVYNEGVIVSIDPNRSHVEISFHDTEKKDEKDKHLKFAFLIDLSHIVNNNIYNQIATTITYEPQFADPIIGVNPSMVNDTINPQQYSYVSGFAGLMTRIKLPIEKIKSLKDKIGDSPSSAILVSSATLFVPLHDQSLSSMNNAISSLGMYYNYCTADYMPGYEPDYSDFDQALFGGYLDRSLKNYRMDITKYVQQLLAGKTDKTTLDIAPSDDNTFSVNGVSLSNSPDNPIRMEIIYTVSK